MSSGRVVIPGSERGFDPKHVRVAEPDARKEIEVTVYLRARDTLDWVDDQAGLLPAERRWLTREELAERYAPREDDIGAVRAFAGETGLEVVTIDPARRAVTLRGRVESVARAFDARELAVFQHPSAGAYRGRRGPLTVPAYLDGVVTGVFGIDERPQAQPQLRRRPSHMRQRDPYTPQQVAAAYNFPARASGRGETVAVIALGGGFSLTDLNESFSGLGLAATPSVSAVGVGGAGNAPGTDPEADSAVMLDVGLVGAVAPGVRIVVYFAPNTDRGFIDAVSTAVHDATNRPSVVSISWGAPESLWTLQAIAQMERVLTEAAALGVTVTVAAGAAGSTDGVDDGRQHVDFPASSPYALACGGTSLQIQGLGIADETVWNDLATGHGATGGGISVTFPLPSYQSVAVQVQNIDTGQLGRGVPDVAGHADPSIGYPVLVNGQVEVLGGTGAVAALWAGLTALLNETLGQAVGFLQPLLYRTATRDGFRDVTLGNNEAYPAGPGWDACTGLGSPDGSALLRALAGDGEAAGYYDSPEELSWQPDLGKRRDRGGERGLDTSEELCFTPHLDVTPPPPLLPGAHFEVEVYLDQRPARPGEETEDFRLAPPPAVDQLEVDVWLRCTSHFVIQGSPLGRLVIRLADADCVPARFALRVADPVPEVGDLDPGLAASFAYNMRQGGLVQRTIGLVLPDRVLEPAPPPEIPGAGAQIDPTAKPPDMDIEIHAKDGRKDLFEVTVRTADRVERCDWPLDLASEDFVRKTMSQFFAKNASARARVASLEGAGIAFFQAAPSCFHKLYWELVDRGAPPETIYIVSEERSVPWELMIPRRQTPAGREKRKPLGLQCAVGRWHRATNITPRQHIPLTDSLVVAPRYSGSRTLKHAEDEVADVHASFPGERAPATFDELDRFLEDHNASLIHFICHGKDDTIQTILLEGKEELTTFQVSSTGLSSACQARRPLVFLNACEVGRPGRALAGVGGFPAALIEEEASAVIAPLWAVDDEAAHQVATQFYAELVKSPHTPFAEILRRLRVQAYGREGDDTFAAYCFYGDPAAAMRPSADGLALSRDDAG